MITKKRLIQQIEFEIERINAQFEFYESYKIGNDDEKAKRDLTRLEAIQKLLGSAQKLPDNWQTATWQNCTTLIDQLINQRTKTK
ncbi:hypothetical protein [Lacunimicrobium album]